MSSDASLDAVLLETHGAGQQREGRWWNKVLDMEEAKNQTLFSLPMTLTNVFYYLITLVSVMFAGHLGELDLAGATLANSWATVTGFALMTGLSGALETLCGQDFGARLYRMLGIYLQASCITSVFFCAIISVIWFYTEPILVLLHQNPQIAAKAALYMKHLIPGLFAYGFLQNILRFLQTQSVVVPLLIISFIPTCIHIGIAYVLVHLTSLGYSGAPVAASISLWISVLMLAVYVFYGKKFEHTWQGVSLESFHHIVSNLKLAIPSAAMVCLEYWAFEILVFLAGLMPNSEITTSLIAMCVNTEAVAYMLIYGLSAAASTRVSNELGAGHPDRAKNALLVTLKLSVVLAAAIVLALAFGRNGWAGLFSDSHSIKEAFAAITPLLAISITADAVQGVLSGVARGCGWQHIAGFVNLGTFYFIGMPIACVLGFKFKLHVKTGLSGALETLCGQSFGAGELRMLGIYLQGSCIISLFFSVIVSVIWIYTEPILILLHQDPHIAIKAALYIKYLIPGLFAYGFLQNILRFLQTQSVVVPLAVLSFIPLCMHIGLAYCMIHLTALKFKGAPIAASISLWISFLMLFLYVFCGKKFKKTWNGVSLESFCYILTNLKIVLPSAAMVW